MEFYQEQEKQTLFSILNMKFILKHLLDSLLIAIGVLFIQMAIGSNFLTACLFICIGLFFIRAGCYLSK